MASILTIVAPVFGVILAGWLAARYRYLPDGSDRVIALFGFKVAMPALLFRAMLGIGEIPGDPWQLIAAYFGGIGLVWVMATLVTRFVLGRPAPDGAAIAMGACFGNTVMLGIPLAVVAFGPQSVTPMALLISIDTPLLWIMATLHVEWAGRRAGSAPPLVALRGVVLDLARNPIVMALIVGTACRLSGLVLPDVPDRFIALVGQAAVPSGLFALGMSLAGYPIKGQAPPLMAICLMKMVLLPATVFALAVHVFALPSLWAAIAILFAAMPVGANAFYFATAYDRAVAPVSAAIAVSTAAAVATVSLVLYLVTPA